MADTTVGLHLDGCCFSYPEEDALVTALRQGADMVIWGAGTQSNNCRQTAAACCKLGLECRLYLSRAAHNDVDSEV